LQLDTFGQEFCTNESLHQKGQLVKNYNVYKLLYGIDVNSLIFKS